MAGFGFALHQLQKAIHRGILMQHPQPIQTRAPSPCTIGTGARALKGYSALAARKVCGGVALAHRAASGDLDFQLTLHWLRCLVGHAVGQITPLPQNRPPRRARSGSPCCSRAVSISQYCANAWAQGGYRPVLPRPWPRCGGLVNRVGLFSHRQIHHRRLGQFARRALQAFVHPAASSASRRARGSARPMSSLPCTRRRAM